MPAATTHGYPYPLGTDPVSDGDDAIKNLAEKVEANLLGGVWAGNATITIVTAGTPVAVVVTFPVGRFTVTPVVALAISGPASQCNVTVSSGPSTTNVTVQGNRTGATGALTAHVIAMQAG